jgi:hypothetical protein
MVYNNEFIDTKNINMMYNLLINSDKIKNNYEQILKNEKFYINNINNFYSTLTNITGMTLLDINKQFILYIYNVLENNIKKSSNIDDNSSIMRLDTIHNNEKQTPRDFDVAYKQRQEDFNDSYKKDIPPTPDFTFNDKTNFEVPNINEFIKDREIELEKIPKVFVDMGSNTDIDTDYNTNNTNNTNNTYNFDNIYNILQTISTDINKLSRISQIERPTSVPICDTYIE